jgi:hypothetical protein
MANSSTGFTFNGMSMSAYSQFGYTEVGAYTNLLQNEVDSGFNYVEISNEPLIDMSTGAITDWIENGYDLTAAFTSIGPAIAAAEAQGLNVFF